MPIRISDAREFTRTLDIIGVHNSGDEMVLRANNDTLLGRGTQEYIVSLRNTILENTTFGGYRLPEEWDQEWNFKLGPIWTPDSLSVSTLQCWLKPEDFVRDSGNTSYTEATDSSSNSCNFIQGTLADQPDIGAKGLNNYEPLDFTAGASSGDQHFYASDSDNDIFNSVAADEWAFAFVLNTGADTDGYGTWFQYGNLGDNGMLSVAQRTNSTNKDIWLLTKSGVSASGNRWADAFSDHNTDNIIVIGNYGGTQSLRVNGSAVSITSSATIQTVNPGTDDAVVGMSYSGSGGAATREFEGKMYEMAFVKRAGAGTSILPDVKKIEGYLAHKYLLTGSLPSDHDYKNEPPRASVTN